MDSNISNTGIEFFSSSLKLLEKLTCLNLNLDSSDIGEKGIEFFS